MDEVINISMCHKREKCGIAYPKFHYRSQQQLTVKPTNLYLFTKDKRKGGKKIRTISKSGNLTIYSLLEQ